MASPSMDELEHANRELVDELARVLWDGEDAKMVALRAGLPSQHIPEFRKPLLFWSAVVRAAADGQVLGGIPALADEAAGQFPENEVFGRYREARENAAVREAEPSEVRGPGEGEAGGDTRGRSVSSGRTSPRRPTSSTAGRTVDNRGATIGQQINVTGTATFSAAPGAVSTRRRRVAILLLASTGVFPVLLALNREARQTTCRVPGLRSVCAAVGIGDVPTPEEQALWEGAIAQRDGDGLREYLQRYPEGAYEDQARTRLAGCREEYQEELGPEREVRFVLTEVADRAHPFATEESARRDAVERGNREAQTICVPSPVQRERLLVSAVVEPHTWRCAPQGNGFACGFDGEVVCRIRDRRSVGNEVCE